MFAGRMSDWTSFTSSYKMTYYGVEGFDRVDSGGKHAADQCHDRVSSTLMVLSVHRRQKQTFQTAYFVSKTMCGDRSDDDRSKSVWNEKVAQVKRCSYASRYLRIENGARHLYNHPRT
jgi:hypothetical protein